jgi:hypothetical protein
MGKCQLRKLLKHEQTAVEEYNFNSDKSFSIYPNPASHEITINTDEQNLSEKVVSIRNELGEQILTKTFFDHNLMIDLSQFSSGIYFCMLQSSGISKTQKIIIVR